MVFVHEKCQFEVQDSVWLDIANDQSFLSGTIKYLPIESEKSQRDILK